MVTVIKYIANYFDLFFKKKIKNIKIIFLKQSTITQRGLVLYLLNLLLIYNWYGFLSIQLHTLLS